MNDLMTQSMLSYVELKKQAEMDLESETDLEKGEFFQNHQENNLSRFFREVAAIKTEMEGITHLISHLQNLNEESKATHSVKVLRGLRDQMESNTVAVLRKAKFVKARLQALDQDNLSSRRIPACREGTPVDRTRTAVSGGLRIKLKELMNNFQSLRHNILSDQKEDLKRAYYNATGREASEQSTERMMVEGGEAKAIYAPKAKAEEAADLEERRHEAAMDMQRSLNKLHQAFLDMAVLVDAQEEHIDDIEQNVAVAGSFISGGTNSFFYASQMRKNERKWVCWVCAVGMIILLVCVISLLTS